jgi:hypothetical protein
MQQIISGLMKPKFNASNVEFILSLTLPADAGSVAWCIRHLADAEMPSCVSSVELQLHSLAYISMSPDP